MRQYQPIWVRLKAMPLSEASTKGVSVTANRRLHPRIIKAVIKEKWLDLGYKIQMDPQKTVLSHHRQAAVLTFTLHLQISNISSNTV